MLRIHSPVLKEALITFGSRTSEASVLWVREEEEPIVEDRQVLRELGIVSSHPGRLPNLVIHHEMGCRLVLIDVAKLQGLIDARRREALSKVFRRCGAGLIFVSAFSSRREFLEFVDEPAWETVVWFADEPNHFVYFDGRVLFGPTVASRLDCDEPRV